MVGIPLIKGGTTALGATGGGLGLTLTQSAGVNLSSSLNLSSMLRSKQPDDLTRSRVISGSDNLNSSSQYPNGITAARNALPVSMRLDETPLGQQLHTPFNTKELLWNGQPIM
jgi:hypothetical protein